MEPEYGFITFNRKPFTVEAVQITEENIDALGPLVGSVKTSGEGEKFITLDRRIVPNVRRAYVGWWITRMNDNLRCYSPKIFEEQFEIDEGYVPVSHLATLETPTTTSSSSPNLTVTTLIVNDPDA
jgi:hypothetical protein